MKKYFFIFIFFIFTSSALAQQNPIEVSAAKELEWDRSARTYTARGQAVAKRGDMEVSSDTLTASYSDGGSTTSIDSLTATGNVVVSSAPYRVYGDKAVYDVASGIATLTGGDLKIATPDETLTAKDKIQFFRHENRLTASGEATARRGTDTLTAPAMSAFFKPGAGGKLALDRIMAEGGVTIKTAKETVTGNTGIYDVAAGKATLTGKIVIRQPGGVIEGTRAEVDLKTGISKLFAEGAASTGGRVKGTFYPKK
jgi:lipopolysaccharide export system protein LptA